MIKQQKSLAQRINKRATGDEILCLQEVEREKKGGGGELGGCLRLNGRYKVKSNCTVVSGCSQWRRWDCEECGGKNLRSAWNSH